MKEWLLFALFLVVGIGMLMAGIVYMRKEKSDLESVKIYRVVSSIGAIFIVAAVIYRALA